jgi:hypothetical protein
MSRFTIGLDRLGLALLGVVLLGACGVVSEDSSTKASSPSATTTASGTPSTTSQSPKTVAKGPLTGDELLWLQGIGTLQKNMTSAVTDMPANMTDESTRTFVEKLRACTPQLAKLAVPTSRLQPVNRLAQQGCDKLAEAASSFEEVAAINVLGPGSDNKIQEQLDHAAAATTRGGELLAKAQLKGFRIQTANQ